ncbi:hypothetical protein [Methanolapillus millepedarum]|uniref:hypothetical protein n=1 Tax=Methanolapillus millepedarum TaxID=3028296 RepID=UPI0030B91705
MSDESSSYYLPQLALFSFLFVSSLFYEKEYKSLHKKDDELPARMISFYIFYVLIAVSWVIFLIYVKRSDLLTQNDPYSFGRFVYVFGTVAISCLIASIIKIVSYYPDKKKFK